MPDDQQTGPERTLRQVGNDVPISELLQLYDVVEDVVIKAGIPSPIDGKAREEFIHGVTHSTLALIEASGDFLAATHENLTQQTLQAATELLVRRGTDCLNTFASHVDKATEALLYLEEFPRSAGSYQVNSWKELALFQKELTRRCREIAWLSCKAATAQLVRKDEGLGSEILTTHADALKWFDQGWTRGEAAETLYRMLMDEVANEFLSGIKRHYGG